MERAMPTSLEAERALLGSVLLDNQSLNIATQFLTKEDFFPESHRLAFEKMLQISERSRIIDLVTLSEELGKVGLLEKAGGAAYLAALTDGVPIGTLSGVHEYCRIVKEKSTMRRLIMSATNLTAKCFEGQDDAAALLELAQSQIFEITEARTESGFQSIRQIATEGFSDIAEVMRHGRQHTGVDTGLVDLDAMTCGLQRGELIIMAGHTSSGKTALAMCIAAQAAIRDEKKVGIFSLEMNKASILTRMLCLEAKIDSHKMRTGFCGREDTERAMTAMGRIASAPIFIDDLAGQTIQQIRSKSRRLKMEHGLDLLIVDYLQLVAAGKKSENRTQEVSYISRSLKGIAKELDVPLIALSQLSRSPDKRKTSRPILSDLRESGSIEQDADVVVFIYRDPRDQDSESVEQGAYKITLILAKQRNGPTGDIPVAFLKPYTKFENYVEASDYESSEERKPYSDD